MWWWWWVESWLQRKSPTGVPDCGSRLSSQAGPSCVPAFGRLRDEWTSAAHADTQAPPSLPGDLQGSGLPHLAEPERGTRSRLLRSGLSCLSEVCPAIRFDFLLSKTNKASVSANRRVMNYSRHVIKYLSRNNTMSLA